MHCANHTQPHVLLETRLQTLRSEADLRYLSVMAIETETSTLTVLSPRSRRRKNQLRMQQAGHLATSCGVTLRRSELKILWPVLVEDIFAMQNIFGSTFSNKRLPGFVRRQIHQMLSPYLRHCVEQSAKIRAVAREMPRSSNCTP